MLANIIILIWFSCLLNETDITKTGMKIRKNQWKPRVTGGSPKIYGSPRGTALKPHIIIFSGLAVWQDGGNGLALWKMELRQLHLARGAMPRETLTGGNTRVQWHLSTTWSVRPIKAQQTTHTDLTPRFIWIQNHHKAAHLGLNSSLKINTHWPEMERKDMRFLAVDN